MSTVAQGRPTEQRRRAWWLDAREMWGSLAITAMWVAVVFASAFGHDIRTGNGVDNVGQHTSVPAGVVVALFATIASWLVARHAFRHDGGD